MDIKEKIIKILPPHEIIEAFLERNSNEYLIAEDFYSFIHNISDKLSVDKARAKSLLIKVTAFKDYLWEILNIGHFSKVTKYHRQLFAFAALQKAILMVIENSLSHNPLSVVHAKIIWELNHGLLLGTPLDCSSYDNILNDCLNLMKNEKIAMTNSIDATKKSERNVWIGDDETEVDQTCDVNVLVKPSILQFKCEYFDKAKPLVIKNSIEQWPALSKWTQSNYLLRICSDRIVPVEIGNNYTTENWSQDLVTFEDFFRRQLLNDENEKQSKSSADSIEYLAQHNLFEQIPALRDDIILPEYCCVSNQNSTDNIDVDIKAWLGPKNTISPMHFDDKNNLLCQVFGTKRIILASSDESINVYPFEGNILKNTSQIDADNLDFERFPLAQKVKFYKLTLRPGDILYIPPKWWHYVRSLSKSFSVSFWWE